MHYVIYTGSLMLCSHDAEANNNPEGIMGECVAYYLREGISELRIERQTPEEIDRIVCEHMPISRDVHKYCHLCRKLTTPGNEMVPVESQWNPQEEAYAMYVCSECDEKYGINDLPWED